MYKNVVLCLAAIILLGGCESGLRHEYEVEPKRVWLRSDASVNVATLDHRPYIVSGDKPENFVGLVRGMFGNPYDVNTKSRDALADDISDSVTRALNKEGMYANKVTVRPSAPVDDAVKALQAVSADRYVLLVLSHWKGDSLVNVAFGYDFEILVLDEQGTVLVKEQFKDKENLGAVDIHQPAGEIKIKNRFRSLIPEIFSSKEIRLALMEE